MNDNSPSKQHISNASKTPIEVQDEKDDSTTTKDIPTDRPPSATITTDVGRPSSPTTPSTPFLNRPGTIVGCEKLTSSAINRHYCTCDVSDGVGEGFNIEAESQLTLGYVKSYLFPIVSHLSNNTHVFYLSTSCLECMETV